MLDSEQTCELFTVEVSLLLQQPYSVVFASVYAGSSGGNREGGNVSRLTEVS